ncbi:MAG: hypothetical protein ABSC08_03740 [Bryobacteraceae bacterium]|jgi:glucan-binding YG repeat protein
MGEKHDQKSGESKERVLNSDQEATRKASGIDATKNGKKVEAGGEPEGKEKGSQGAPQQEKPKRKAVKRSSAKKGAAKKAKSQDSRKAKDGVTKAAEGAKASGAESERDASGRFARSQAEPAAAQPRKTATDSDSKNQGNGNGRGTGVNLMTEAGQKKLVNKLLSKADQLAGTDGFKLSAADLIRLIQLQKELTAKPPQKVTVQWVEDEGE